MLQRMMFDKVNTQMFDKVNKQMFDKNVINSLKNKKYSLINRSISLW